MKTSLEVEQKMKQKYVFDHRQSRGLNRKSRKKVDIFFYFDENDEQLKILFVAHACSSCSHNISGSPKLPLGFLLNNIRLRARDFYHAQKSRVNYCCTYKSTSCSKLHLNPLNRHLKNAKKRPLVHTATLLTMIYHRLYNNPSFSRILIGSCL